jgi:hypothetical protein
MFTCFEGETCGQTEITSPLCDSCKEHIQIWQLVNTNLKVCSR